MSTFFLIFTVIFGFAFLDQDERVFAQATDSTPGLPNVAASSDPGRSLEPDEILKNLYGTSYAIVIGINKYSDPKVPSLSAAVADANRMEAKLKTMGFTVIKALDQQATRSWIIGHLEELVSTSKENDRVLFYFAGHGTTKEKAAKAKDGAQMGYMLPADYDSGRHFFTAISLRDIGEISAAMKANQVVYLLDSCFSGGVLDVSQRDFNIKSNKNADLQYLKDIAAQRAHVVITAGSKDEKVSEAGGAGAFTKVVLEALSQKYDQRNAEDGGYLTAIELAAQVKKKVPRLLDKLQAPRQTPQYGTLEGTGDVILTVYRSIERTSTTDERGSALGRYEDGQRFKLKKDQEEFELRQREAEEQMARERKEQDRQTAEERQRLARERAEQESKAAEERARFAREKSAQEYQTRMEREQAAKDRKRAEEAEQRARDAEQGGRKKRDFVAPSF